MGRIHGLVVKAADSERRGRYFLILAGWNVTKDRKAKKLKN